MEKRKIFEYFLLLVGTIFIELIIIFIFLNIYLQPTYVQSNNNIYTECQEHTLKEIEQIALNVSNHSFISNVYDCSDFSKTLVENLKSINVSAYCVSGFYKSIPHTFVGLILNNKTYYVEATNGFFISDKDFKENYIILKEGYCL
jgi:hypothetical protein